jgi:hypothetical protein
MKTNSEFDGMRIKVKDLRMKFNILRILLIQIPPKRG